MQFNILALTVAAMASVAVATETVTVYACPSSTGLSGSAATAGSSAGESSGITSGSTGSSSGESSGLTSGSNPSGVAAASGVAAPTASSGVVSSPSGTSSPIAYATGAAGHIQVSAFGMVVAGAVALVRFPFTIPHLYLETNSSTSSSKFLNRASKGVRIINDGVFNSFDNLA
ncbi:hypothetical protein BCON_0004g00900 [Botryotinia convoluta]|uniref:Uncharacterized protein n=1 Tax=Botryotinia convoluta TaxID=54673 RepID=A0A4Z1J7K1_9HELO|nr:hypothetical protein BCON_0004g00900 [Botryotinia convoluta]